MLLAGITFTTGDILLAISVAMGLIGFIAAGLVGFGHVQREQALAAKDLIGFRDKQLEDKDSEVKRLRIDRDFWKERYVMEHRLRLAEQGKAEETPRDS